MQPDYDDNLNGDDINSERERSRPIVVISNDSVSFLSPYYSVLISLFQNPALRGATVNQLLNATIHQDRIHIDGINFDMAIAQDEPNSSKKMVAKESDKYQTIQSVAPLSNLRLLVVFANGTTKTYDCHKLLQHAVFKRLANPEIFQTVAVTQPGHYGVTWPGTDMDLAEIELWINGVE